MPLRWIRIEIARTSKRTIAVLHVLALHAPIYIHHGSVSA
jgi:hypothetical protein